MKESKFPEMAEIPNTEYHWGLVVEIIKLLHESRCRAEYKKWEARQDKAFNKNV